MVVHELVPLGDKFKSVINSGLKYIRQFPFAKEFVKFCIVGSVAALTNFIVYISLTIFLNIWYVYSAACAFAISAVFNFTTNKLWTFRNKDIGRRAVHQVAKFVVVMVSGLVINTFLIYFFTERGGLDWRLSWVIATGLITFWNFGFNRFWTFSRRRDK